MQEDAIVSARKPMTSSATDLTDAIGNAVDVYGPEKHHHLDFMQSDSSTLPLQKMKVSRSGAVARDEPVFGEDKESEVEQGDRENHTANDDAGDDIWTMRLRGMATPESTLDDILVEASSTSDTATTGRSATFYAVGYWNKTATRSTTKSIAAAKRKAKKDQPMPVENAYTCDKSLKKLKPTDPDTGVVNNELIVPGQHILKGKTLIKKSDWAEIASAKASAKTQQGPLYNKRQMPRDKIKADQQSTWYKSIQSVGNDSSNRAVPMGGAREQSWYLKPLQPALRSLNSSPALSPL
ncbi:hypothetical protein BDK51DRAFT_48378 [Blyttiomyces helicus]|uniref:Uncharacterized protein n=1 Tax=Blyttiomyces helicus TaxID=388810 RepID=A0A4P9WIT3_9FUNG|nr:hypothetical protein BDK51DRAFT_48378 [Blyttiomyces helicus]|eukprot:RKO91813.1 hypothetical protein BDK51DRAFT_48378 [Blyttiomyces helicus]